MTSPQCWRIVSVLTRLPISEPIAGQEVTVPRVVRRGFRQSRRARTYGRPRRPFLVRCSPLPYNIASAGTGMSATWFGPPPAIVATVNTMAGARRPDGCDDPQTNYTSRTAALSFHHLFLRYHFRCSGPVTRLLPPMAAVAGKHRKPNYHPIEPASGIIDPQSSPRNRRR